MKMLDERELKIMCETIKKEQPDKHEDYYKMFLSTEVLRLMVDNEWVNQTLFQEHPVKEKKNYEAFEYFRSATNGFEWQERVSKLAERIYNLRRVPNIQNVIEDIKRGELVSRFAELEVGGHLHSRGIKFEFVLPKGKKGEDFDIKVTDPLIVNCEIKHKIESTNLSENTITNTIRSANDQIPKDTPGLIFIKIPEQWILEPEIIKIIIKTFKPFFRRNSSHIIGIMLRWEQADPVFKGVFYWKYRFFFNEDFKTTNSLNSFIKQLESNRNNWTSFSGIIHKYI